MIWPTELKERLREKVGSRGLTDYVLESVRMRLAQEELDRRKLRARVVGVEPVPGDGVSVHVQVEPDIQEVASEVASMDTRPDCPTCHAPLIEGECWSCG